MFLVIYPLLISLATGYLLVNLFFPVNKDKLFFQIKFFLSIGTGIGLSSCIFSLWLFFSNNHDRLLLFILDVFLLIFLLLLNLKKKKIILHPIKISLNKPFSKLTYFFNFIFLFLLLISTFLIINNPFGRWDAWAIWNLKARFLYRGIDHWKDTFSQLIPWSHPDYPILLPGFIARSWIYNGNENLIVAPLISLVFMIAIIGSLTYSLSLLKNKLQGYLAGITLMLTPFFLKQAAYQYADILVSFYFLATITLILLFTFTNRKHYSFMFLAGLLTGFATYTKNEGILFLGIITIAVTIYETFMNGFKSSIKIVSLFIIGCLPVFLLLLYFKMNLAPTNDIISYNSFPDSLEKMLTLSRYKHVSIIFITNLLSNILYFFPAILLFFYLLFIKFVYKVKRATDETNSNTLLFMILITMSLGYFFIYIISPNDIEWHIKTSQDRLLLQLWPSILFTYFVSISIIKK